MDALRYGVHRCLLLSVIPSGVRSAESRDLHLLGAQDSVRNTFTRRSRRGAPLRATLAAARGVRGGLRTLRRHERLSADSKASSL